MKTVMQKIILNCKRINNTSITLMIGVLISQLINLIIMPVITRFYTPEEVGQYSLVLTMATLLVVLFTLYLDKAIVISNDDESRKEIIKLVLVNVSFFILILILCQKQLIYLLDKLNLEKELYTVLIILAISITVNQIIYGLMNSYKKYNNMAISRIVIPLGLSVFSIGIFPMVFGITSAKLLIFSQILGYLISLISMFVINKTIFLKLYKTKSKRKLFEIIDRYKNYALYSTPHSLLDLISSNALIFAIASIYGAGYLGLYSFTLRLLKAPLSIIGVSLGQSFIKNFSIYYDKQEFTKIKNEYLKLLLILAGISFPIFTTVFLIGDDIFAYFFGAKWAESGRIASILSIWLFINFIGSPAVSVYIVLNKQKTAFKLSVLQNILIALVIILTIYLKLNFYQFLFFYSLISLLNNLIFYSWITKLIINLK